MLDDFDAIRHDLEPRTIKVWAMADAHIGARECDLDGLRAFVRRVQADPDSYLVLVGDILNNGVKDSLTNVYEETMPPSMQVQAAVDLLRPVSDRILGVVGGNHERRSAKAVDLDPMYAVCVHLGIQDLYRPNMAFVRVSMRNGRVQQVYNLLITHGRSAAAKRRFAYSVEGVDAVITGHTHDGLLEKPARICMTGKGNVVVKPLISLTATSWLRYGGYGAANLYAPKSTSDPQHMVLEWANSNNRRCSVRVVW